MIAFSGVRSSWLMFARNCDLCWLASASWPFASWSASKRRAFSMAMTTWSANVSNSAICRFVKGCTVVRRSWIQPVGVPSRMSGTQSKVR